MLCGWDLGGRWEAGLTQLPILQGRLLWHHHGPQGPLWDSKVHIGTLPLAAICRASREGQVLVSPGARVEAMEAKART